MTALLDSLARALSTTAFRLTAAIMAAFLLTAAAVTGTLFWQTNEVLTEQVRATVTAEAAALRREAETGGIEALTAAVKARSRPEGPGLYYLADATGTKLAGNLNRVPPELSDAERGGVFHYEAAAGALPQERLGVALPVALKDGARLVVGRDIEDQRGYAARIKRIFLVGFAVLSVAGLLGGLAISRTVLKRIEAMSGASRTIMSGDMSRRIPLSGSGDELDDLAESLNRMLERIEQLMSGLKEVSDNIAHDLKTPLTRLRNRAEAALRDGRGSEAYREGLERTIEEADDLIKTFNALLLIARLEAGAVEENSETFDLAPVVRDVAELYEPVADESGVDLDVETREGHVVSANRQLVGQAVANLIDNALKYGTREPGGATRITVRIASGAGHEEVVVADNGPGIAACDRERVLKRFVRLEESRTRPGTGLGLSLVAAVARLHKGQVRLEDNGPGLRAVLALPAARGALAGSRPVA